MLLHLTPDQEFFLQTTARFLDSHVPAGELRRLRDDPAGFEEKYWRSGAELGWTSLLVDEDHGGGTISGRGVVDLTLIAHEFGRHAAPGPLVATNVVAAALSEAGADVHRAVLEGLLSGTSIASWCSAGMPMDGKASAGVEICLEGATAVLNGNARPVEAAAQADQLLVTGRTGTGLTQILVPSATPGVSISPMRTVDLTRRFALVTFDGARVPADAIVGGVGEVADQVERQFQLALVMLNAESVGAMEAAFDMTLAWAFDRYSFGRPLASYQALKHRFADMKTWLEASHAVCDAAAAAVESGSDDASELVRAAKAYVGQVSPELVQECVQLHGGIGVTFDHDLHVFLRRVVVDRALHGTPSEQRQSIADLAERREWAS
jgi:alkylation response protein AidB-like acyl-CoA dehydrogenase